MDNEKRKDEMDSAQDKMKRAEEQIEEKKAIIPEITERKKKKYFVIPIVLVVFIASFFYNYIEMEKMRSPIHSSVKKVIKDINIHFYLVYIKIEEYRREHGRYPLSLDDEIREEFLEYALHPDSTYTLSYQFNDTLMTFNSTEDPERLLSQEFLEMIEGGRVK